MAAMATTSVEEMLKLATRLATEAGTLVHAHRHPCNPRRKKDATIVTDTDFLLQDHILDAVTRAYPDHAVLGEETTRHGRSQPQPAEARYCWVIDPLDGTRNYALGFPCFATSLAVLNEGRPVVAVIREHNLGHLYTAVAGGGAALNGSPARVRDPAQDDDLLLGVPSSTDTLSIRVVTRWVGTPRFACRNVGSTATHLGMVASGMLAGAFAKQCKIWDLAAGMLLVGEAGGIVTDVHGNDCLPFRLDADGNQDLPFLAAGAKTHGLLLDSIRAATA
jgi:myo-inositol-1(or 4)-monophosphatase